jgi:peptide deformylase
MEIITIGNKILNQKAKRVAHIDDAIRNLIVAMIDTMVKNRGIGLAAPQVGVSKRIIVALNQEDNQKAMVFINPEIVWTSDETISMEEGCLSIPEQSCIINRAKEVIIKFRDMKGKPHRVLFGGLNARIIQHEIDHLDGVLMNEY